MKAKKKINCQLKPLLCIIALVIFIYQMAHAFKRYFSDPHLFVKETIDIKDVAQLPVITICPHQVYDFKKSAKIGYKGMEKYFTGELQDGQQLSWTGNTKDTYENVSRLLFGKMYEALDKVVMRNAALSELETTIILDLPVGPCKSLHDYQISTRRGGLNIQLDDGEFTIFVTDRAKEVHYKTHMNSMLGSSIHLKVDKSKQVLRFYQVTLEQTYLREGQDGCRNYDADDDLTPTYAACVEQELQKKFLPIYGCMVPWMSPNNPCNTTLTGNPTEHEALVNETRHIFLEALYGFDHEFEKCPPPCLQTSIRARYFDTFDWPRFDSSFIVISFDDTVQQSIMKSAYGSVDLLIEAGSSLGLWLGLSAIGLYDLMVLAWAKLKGAM